MNHARITVGRKIEGLSFDEKGFLQLGEHDDAADRRLRGGHQQSVVAASVQPDDCRGSKAPETVGFKPFPAAVAASRSPQISFVN